MSRAAVGGGQRVGRGVGARGVPRKPDLRVTLLRPAKEEDTPDQKYVPLRDVKHDTGAQVVAVSETTPPSYVPTPRPSVMIIDETGSTTANLPLPNRCRRRPPQAAPAI